MCFVCYNDDGKTICNNCINSFGIRKCANIYKNNTGRTLNRDKLKLLNQKCKLYNYIDIVDDTVYSKYEVFDKIVDDVVCKEKVKEENKIKEEKKIIEVCEKKIKEVCEKKLKEVCEKKIKEIILDKNIPAKKTVLIEEGKFYVMFD